MSKVFNDQDNESDKSQLTKLNSKTSYTNPTSNNELSNKIFNDDKIDKNTILRRTQTLENNFQISAGNDFYSRVKNLKNQFIDTTIIHFPNQGAPIF